MVAAMRVVALRGVEVMAAVVMEAASKAMVVAQAAVRVEGRWVVAATVAACLVVEVMAVVVVCKEERGNQEGAEAVYPPELATRQTLGPPAKRQRTTRCSRS